MLLSFLNRFLTCARILHPDSKLGTYRHLADFYEQPRFDYMHIMRTMDIMEEHYDEYITHLFEKSRDIIKRDTSVCFYDCSNYYFETETEDDDYVDEVTGETVRGLRKYGPSKEHRPNPIVEMGLFMDREGIPLSMCITSGSDNEQTTAIPLEKKLTQMFKGEKIHILCGCRAKIFILDFQALKLSHHQPLVLIRHQDSTAYPALFVQPESPEAPH